MIRVKVVEGQSLEDLALLQYGSIDGVGQILKDNKQLSWVSTLQPGDEIFIDEQRVINVEVTQYLAKKASALATAEGAYVPNTTPGDFNNDFNSDFS